MSDLMMWIMLFIYWNWFYNVGNRAGSKESKGVKPDQGLYLTSKYLE